MIKIIFIIFLFFIANLHSQTETILQEVDVKEGDTLWSIANYYLKDPKAWPEILKYNKLPSSDPNVILPGMKLKVPVMLIKEELRPAYLIYLLNEAEYRRKDALKWNKAKLNLELFNDDGFRTLFDSKAKIRFITGEIVSLEENSFIIVKPKKDSDEIKLFSGGVRASKTKVLTDSAIITPLIEPKTQNPDFRTKVKPDKTTLVEVYEGIVDVTAQGKTVRVNSGFGTEIKFLQPPSLPQTLPPLPELDIHTKETVSDKLSLNLKIPELNQEKQTNILSDLKIEKYHLQISDNDNFKNIIIDKTEFIKKGQDIDLKKYKLNDGKYYYRISLINELGFESKFSLPKMFIVDTTAPIIEIIKPNQREKINTDFVYIEGKIDDPQATLSINRKIIEIDKFGFFSTSLLLTRKGENKILLTAKDNAGNTGELILIVEKTNEIKQQDSSSQQISEEDTNKKIDLKWTHTPIKITTSLITLLIIFGVLKIMFFS